MGTFARNFQLYFVLTIGMLSTLVASAGVAAFTEEAVTLITSDGVRLSASWVLPQKEQAKGVVIFLPGSGNVGLDGDESSPYKGGGYRGALAKLGEQVTRRLAEEGFVGFRYAKRGFEDAKQLSKQTAPYLFSDAKVAVAMARARFPGLKVGIAGISEGAQLATLLASEQLVDAVFLLALPTRYIDDIFAYQYMGWPVDLMANRLDTDRDGEITATEWAKYDPSGVLPLFGAGMLPKLTWQAIDRDGNGSISIVKELVSVYRGLYLQVLDLLRTAPDFADWFKAMRELRPFPEVAAKVQAPVYLYQGMADAQLNWSWTVSDSRYFKTLASTHLYPGLGHCFAPMDGEIGQVKASGPFVETLMSDLLADVRHAFVK